MKDEKFYDYIIAGAGCAGLSLALHLIRSGQFSDKKILLVDQSPKKANDRTWCFWQEGEGLFEPVVYRQWEKLWFHSKDFSKALHIEPYRYKMIRGADFYAYCLDEIARQSNFTLLQQQVDHVFSSEVTTGITAGGVTYHCTYVFNSIPPPVPPLSSKEYWLLQHFKGWTIETVEDSFDPSTATLMDFRMSQQQGTAFCYVLPLSPRKALVEYTLFSPALLPDEAYNEGLRTYLRDVLKLEAYTVCEEEFGVIPMTNFAFSRGQHRIVNIGTSGGQTKGSSGYTFQFIQKHSAALVKQLADKGNPFLSRSYSRFRFYDSVLLRILHQQTLPGDEIFTRLFKKNKAQNVLKFLDNETSLREELSIISSLPTLPFLKSAIGQVF